MDRKQHDSVTERDGLALFVGKGGGICRDAMEGALGTYHLVPS